MTDRLVFSKSKQARFISHLDLMRTFQRGFARAGIEIKHTEGYNPHPFVSIALPLSVGYSSDCEILEFGLVSGATRESLPEILSSALPEGIEILECYEGEVKMKHIIYVDYVLTLDYEQGILEGAVDAWNEFLSQKSHVIEKKSKKARSGKVEIDIMPMIRSFIVKELEIVEGGKGNTLTILARLSAQNPGLNPELIRASFVTVHPEFAPDGMHCHREKVLDKEALPFR